MNVKTNYIELDRTFSLLKGKDDDRDSNFESYFSSGFSSSNTWENLLKEYRVVVLAEAGSGKTEELRSITNKLRSEKKYAFFIRLEHLCNTLDTAFDIGNMDEYSEWLDTDEPGWFFLDSVDEARLAGVKQFEAAIRYFSQCLGESKNRSRIFVTSRPSEWRPTSDLELIRDKLSVKVDTILSANSNTEENIPSDETSSNVSSGENSEEVEPVVYALDALNLNQIEKFSIGRGVENAKDFVDAIEKSDAQIFAKRPQDLDYLIDFWKINERIGCLSELVDNSIQLRIVENDPDRSGYHKLTKDEAEYGVTVLAAAVTLQQQTRLLIPDRQNKAIGIEVKTILCEWDDNKIRALLARPIFDEAIYGTVSFHLRTVREYLTAQWILKLIAEGKSRRDIERLFFRNIYGVDVVIPIMRPILSWVILFDDSIREKAAHVAPEVLIEGGDPSILDVDIRADLLKRFCEYNENKIIRETSFDINSIQRFSHTDLGPTINSLISKYYDDDDLTQLLLRMVWQAAIRECVQIATKIALDKNKNKYTRVHAIRAVNSSGSEEEINFLLNVILDDKNEDDHQVLSEIISGIGNNRLTSREVADLLKQVKPPGKYNYTPLQHSIETYIERCPIEQLYTYVVEITPLLKKPPYIERRYLELSEENAWLLEGASYAAKRLIEVRHDDALTEEVLCVISLNQISQDYGIGSSSKNVFGRIVPEWSEINYKLFWHDVKLAREYLDNKSEERLTEWWQARNLQRVWQFKEKDLELIVNDIIKKTQLDDKLVALSLAFSIYRENGRKRVWREKLKKAVTGEPELESALHNYFHPPAKTAEQKKWDKKHADFERRQRKRQQKIEANQKNWKEWLINNIAVLSDNSVANRKTIYQATVYLLDWLRKHDEGRDRWSQHNWRLLRTEFGEDVAAAFRDGSMGYWRAYMPEIRSEGMDNPNSIPYSDIYGLTGLDIESEYTNNWPKNLTSDEAKLACRYAFREINGFPRWLQKLHEYYRKEIEEAILKEIEWEFSSYKDEAECHYVLSDVVWHGDWIKEAIVNSLTTYLEKYTPFHTNTISQTLEIVLNCKGINRNKLIDLAKIRHDSEINDAIKVMWHVAWFCLDAQDALKALHSDLDKFKKKEEATDYAMIFITSLFGDRRHKFNSIYRSYYKAGILCDLYLLILKYISFEDDINRSGGGAYSPTLRDDAQHARGQIFGLLTEIPGKETYLAIKKIARHQKKYTPQSWFETKAKSRAEEDSDLTAWTADDIRSFSNEAEHEPHDNRDLFDLIVSRLQWLKHELEDGDSSIADILIKADRETQLRKYIGNWLRDRSHNRYSVPQEEELADAKKPDIRIHCSGIDAPVPIELKVADRNWSGTDLFRMLESQLCGNYLRDIRSGRGIYLLIYRGEMNYWVHPHSRKRLNFDQLVNELQSHAHTYIGDNPDIQNISVIGIDLTFRNKPIKTPTKRKASKKKTAKKTSAKKKASKKKTLAKKKVSKKKTVKKKLSKINA